MIRTLRPQKIDSLRPTNIDDYIGQENIKDLLWTSIQAAKGRNQPLDHVLLNGPPGLGKTTLANIIASEMGWKIKTILAPSLSSPKDAVQLLLQLPPATMLFIDEVHRIRRPVQEQLYPALEDGKLYSDLNPNIELELHPMTIIGATTDIGKLSQPFIDRFGLQFQLVYYSVDELGEILLGSANKLHMDLDWPTVDVISIRSRGTPRIANNFLKRLRDYADVEQQPVTAAFAEKIITNKLHTNDIGLRPIDIRYLRALDEAEAGQGAEAIAARIAEEVDTVESFIEPYLTHLGFMERRKSGRWLTTAGKNYIDKYRG